MGEVFGNGWKILVDEPPSIAILWYGTSRCQWWHVWHDRSDIRNKGRVLLVVIPDVSGGTTTWDPEGLISFSTRSNTRWSISCGH
jgi:hypothetical protein